MVVIQYPTGRKLVWGKVNPEQQFYHGHDVSVVTFIIMMMSSGKLLTQDCVALSRHVIILRRDDCQYPYVKTSI